MESISSTVSPVTGFRVVNGAAGELKLTWDAPVGTGKLWITRDGETLGFLSRRIPPNRQSSGQRTGLTYELIFENAAGKRSFAVSAMGKPTGSPDTEKPTHSCNGRAQVSGTNVILTGRA